MLYVVALSHVNAFIFSQDAAAQVLWRFSLATVQTNTQNGLMKPEGAGRNLETELSEVLVFMVHKNIFFSQIMNSLNANEL